MHKWLNLRWRASAVVAIIVVLATCLSLLNYWQQHATALSTTDAVASFEGVIEIGILESRSSGQVLTIYNIKPNVGSIKLIRETRLALGSNIADEPLPDGAHIERCSDEMNASVRSPDSRFVASCMRGPGKSLVIVTDVLAKTKAKTIFVENFSRVRGIAWSPDSKAVAVLKEAERTGYGPVELVSALSGHPVPYDSIGFVAVSVGENEGLGLPYIAREFRSAWSYIRWQR